MKHGSASKPRLLTSFTKKFKEIGNPDGLDIDEIGNIWTSGPGGLLIVKYAIFKNKMHLREFLFSQNGEVIARDILSTIKVSNVLLAPDGFVYLTGSHGVYRRKRNL